MRGSKWLNIMSEEEKHVYLDYYQKTPINKVLTKAFKNSLKILEKAYQKINRKL
jgi:hypothetical protein